MQARTLVVTDPAKADLDSIYDYIAVNSPNAADRFVTAIVTDLHRLAAQGYTGLNRGWIRPNLRLHVYGNYCIYFRTDNGNFVVLRVVHGARDIDAIIFEPVGN